MTTSLLCKGSVSLYLFPYAIRSHFVPLKLVDSARKLGFFPEKREDRPRPVGRVSQCGAFSSACGTPVARYRTGACLRGELVKDPTGSYPNGEAFEVEFLALDGHTAALATLLPSQVRPVARTDISHAREISPRETGSAESKPTLSIERRAAEFSAMSWSMSW